MNRNLIMRSTYSLAWVLAMLAVVYRAIQFLRVPIGSLPVSSRGLLFASGFLFLAGIATNAYEQFTRSVQEKGKGSAA